MQPARAHTHARPRTRTHAHAHAHSRAHAHAHADTDTHTHPHLVPVLSQPRRRARDRDRARRLQDAARLVEDVLDGRADGGVVNQQHAVHQLAAQPERLRADLAAAQGMHACRAASASVTGASASVTGAAGSHVTCCGPGCVADGCARLTCLTATPSAKPSTRHSVMRRPCSSDIAIALAPVGSTPITCQRSSDTQWQHSASAAARQPRTRARWARVRQRCAARAPGCVGAAS